MTGVEANASFLMAARRTARNTYVLNALRITLEAGLALCYFGRTQGNGG